MISVGGVCFKAEVFCKLGKSYLGIREKAVESPKKYARARGFARACECELRCRPVERRKFAVATFGECRAGVFGEGGDVVNPFAGVKADVFAQARIAER